MTLKESLSQMREITKDVFEFSANVLGIFFVQAIFRELLNLL